MKPTLSKVLDQIFYEIHPCQLPPVCVIERYKAKYPKCAKAIQDHFDRVEEMICSGEL